MFPDTQERSVLLSSLDDRLRTILRFKLREFVHLNPCFDLITSLNDESFSIDIRNQRRLLSMDDRERLMAQEVRVECPNKSRVRLKRRKLERRLAI